MKRALSDRIITALKAASDGLPYDVRDTTTPSFGIRIMPAAAGQKPSKTFILIARYGGPRSNPRRRSLGRVGTITLDDARAKARRWLALVAQGRDPAVEEKLIADEAERRRANTIAAIVEDFITMEATPKQRRGQHVARELRRVVIPLWGARPAASITRAEVQSMIEAVRDKGTVRMLAAHGIKLKRGYDRGTPTYARSLLSYLKTVFAWAIGRDCYGLESSPCDHVSAERILGPRRQRTRSLAPDELFAFWRAVTRLPYPIGPAYQLLALAGLRLNEVMRAERSEFDLRAKVWTIPESRMKGRNSRARAHAIPLTPQMVKIIEALPANGTKYLFTKGTKPHYLDDKEKADLDRRMLRTLRALARKRGEAPPVELVPWVNHDLRRTLRSALSQVRVDGKVRFHEDVKEAVWAHVKKGISGTYDVYDLLPEKAEALEHWDAHLMRIVAPPRIVPLRRAG